jgi:serine/threonine-protein kinase RsbW
LLGGASDDDVCLLALEFGLRHDFHHALPSEPRALADLRSALRAWLRADGVAAEDVDAVVLACSEIAGNAIEHAYRTSEGSVHVLGDRDADAVVVEIRDRGSWRAPGAPGGRGRGLQIVEHVMDDVRVDRGRGTTVIMRRMLGARRA